MPLAPKRTTPRKKQQPLNIPGLEEQQEEFTNLALQALHTGLLERNPAYVKMWLDCMLLISQNKQEENNQGSATILLSNGTVIEM